MTSLELTLFQGALLLIVAPVCAGIGNTIVTLVKEKTLVIPWVMYRRENSIVASVALGSALFLGMLLPLLGFEGYAATYGNIVAFIAILAVVGGACALLDAKSIVPMALSAYGAALLALGIAAASINGADMLLAMSGNTQPSTILAVIAMALVCVALRNDAASERTRDIRMVLQAAFGVFLVNLLTLMTIANLFTHNNHAFNALIVLGKAIGIALIVELIAAGIRRHVQVTSEGLVRGAIFLGILSIIISVWSSNPTL